MKAIITIGVPGSGKSTYAASLSPEYYEINRDEIREWLFGTGYQQNSTDEKAVNTRVNQALALAVFIKQDIIISDTNLNPKYRKILVDKLLRLGYNVVYKEFPITYDEMRKRNLEREDKPLIPSNVLTRMWTSYERYIAGE